MVDTILEYFLRKVNGFTENFLKKKRGEMMILDVLKKWCKDNSTSISALEEKCGLGNATIQKWEKCMPRIDTLQKVSEVTKIPISELIGSEKD